MSEIKDMQYEYIEQLKAEVSLLNALFFEIRQLLAIGPSEKILREIERICIEAIEDEPYKGGGK